MIPEPTPGTLGEAYRWAVAQLRAAGVDSPQRDARELLAAAAGIAAGLVLADPQRAIGVAVVATLAGYVARRAQGREPVSRILGARGFYGLDFEVTAATLDPRPDTETIVEAARELADEGAWPGGAPGRILDIGTGTGAIVIALLTVFPAAQGIAVDIARDALATAARNAERNGVAPRLSLQEASWADGIAGPFDLVVSNPPYIPTQDISGLEPEVRAHDPRAALDGGRDGLDAYRAILPRAARLLRPGGWLLLEIGEGQEGDVNLIADDCPLAPFGGARRHWHDLGGIVRCLGYARQP